MDYNFVPLSLPEVRTRGLYMKGLAAVHKFVQYLQCTLMHTQPQTDSGGTVPS